MRAIRKHGLQYAERMHQKLHQKQPHKNVKHAKELRESMRRSCVKARERAA
jgi:hypothetical protein